MKVLIAIPTFYPAVIYGGPIFSSLYACRHLTKSAHIDLSVLTTNANGKEVLKVSCGKRELVDEDINVVYINRNKFLAIFNIKAFLREIYQAELIHIQSVFSNFSIICLFCALLLKKKILMSPRGQFGSWCLNERKILKFLWLCLFVYPISKYISWHATSVLERDEILQLFPKSKVYVIPNGIEPCEYKNVPKMSAKECILHYTGVNKINPTLIVSMGRLQKKKRV